MTRVAAAGEHGQRAPALLRAVRPKQWTKNLLVLAAPIAAGEILNLEVLLASGLAFVAFTLAASGVYLVNDVRDIEEDRRHPTRRHRPVASGEVSARTAMVVATVAFLGAGVVALTAGVPLLLVIGTYVALAVVYSLWLKAQPVLDLAIVAAGFVLRAAAGGVAAGIILSQWFLLVAAFGSLLMVAGKRYSELRELGEEAAAARSTLDHYSLGYLRFVWTLSATVLVATYSLWAFEVQARWDRPALAQLSIAPFVLGVLRYAADIDRGHAGAPEDIVLSDRVLQALGAAWAVVFVAGVMSG